MAVQQPAQRVSATMTVLVNRDAPGDLAAGVEGRIAAVEAVESVEVVDLRGVRPGLNDLRVEVRADLRVHADPPDGPGDPGPGPGSDPDPDPDLGPGPGPGPRAAEVEAALADGFGIRDVTVAE